MRSKLTACIMAGLAISAMLLAGCIQQAPQTPTRITLTIPSSAYQTTTTPITTTIAPTTTAAPTTSAAPVTGSIEVRVTDAPPSKQMTAVEVTVSSVDILKVGGKETDEAAWLPLKMSGSNTFDLLKIQGLEQVLSTGDLTGGQYNQIRMAVSRVRVTLQGGQPQDATVPSGKLKFNQPFSVVAGKTTVLLFDFVAAQSLNVTGEGKIIFKPVIKLIVPKAPDSLKVTTDRLPNGEVGIAYNGKLEVAGGKTPYAWSVSKGSLPAGLTLNPTTGAVSGTPTGDGTFSFSVEAKDSSQPAKSDVQAFTVIIAAAGALQITTTRLPDTMANVAYSVTLSAVGGTAPYTWSITAGGLPDGVTLDPATGVISGAPPARGDFNFQVTVTDSVNHTATQTLGISVEKDLAP